VKLNIQGRQPGARNLTRGQLTHGYAPFTSGTEEQIEELVLPALLQYKHIHGERVQILWVQSPTHLNGNIVYSIDIICQTQGTL